MKQNYLIFQTLFQNVFTSQNKFNIRKKIDKNLLLSQILFDIHKDF